MSSRNTRRDAELAQDAADFGANSDDRPDRRQDESGHVTFRLPRNATGPNHTDSNFHQSMVEAVVGLYEEQQDQQRQVVGVGQEDNEEADNELVAEMEQVEATMVDEADEVVVDEQAAEEAFLGEQEAEEPFEEAPLLNVAGNNQQQQLHGGYRGPRGRGGESARGRGRGRGRGRAHGGRGRGHAGGVGGGGVGGRVGGRQGGAPGGRRVELQNPVTLQEMEDGVVDKGVYSKYCNDIIHFSRWMHENELAWFTDHGKAMYDELNLQQEDETKLLRRRRIKEGWMGLLRNAKQHPIVHTEAISPSRVMEGWISKQANQLTLKPLSSAGYGGKRTAIFHLFRVHNGKGPSQDFQDEMTALWKGFSRTNNKRKIRARRPADEPGDEGVLNDDVNEDGEESEVSDEEDDDDRDEFKEGKEPMSPELYRSICKWLLGWGNLEGIFGALFIVLTWNLVCRGNNTAKIRLSHVKWSVFDALTVNFKHTKTDQQGDAKRKKRHLFSNVLEYYIDLPFIMGLYLSSCFSFGQTRGRRLFPGGSSSQAKRISKILSQVLKEHEQEVLNMGYDSISDIGVHSIRKGAASYLASLPGGPSPAAICLRGGWTMGQVKDIYFHQMQAGDEFTGRCISLLNMMSGDFAMSPAFFKEDTDEDLISSTITDVFPHFQSTAGMGRILRMCLASLVFHREKVLAFDANHIARTISLFRDPSKLQPVINKVITVRAWESHRHLSGVPSHIKELVDLQALRVEQSQLSQVIFEKVMLGLTEYFDTRRIGGGEMTEARIREMIAEASKINVDDLVKRMEEKVDSLKTAFQQFTTDSDATRQEDTAGAARTYLLRTNILGQISRLPSDFQFPKGGCYDCWTQWNVGDGERSIPPLRKLGPREFLFIDNLPKTDAEKRSQTGKFRNQRRPSRKIFSDIKFLCKYIESKASEAGVDTTDVSLANVRIMFESAVKHLIIPGEGNRRVDQLKWRTIVKRIRKKLKEGG